MNNVLTLSRSSAYLLASKRDICSFFMYIQSKCWWTASFMSVIATIEREFSISVTLEGEIGKHLKHIRLLILSLCYRCVLIISRRSIIKKIVSGNFNYSISNSYVRRPKESIDDPNKSSTIKSIMSLGTRIRHFTITTRCLLLSY